MAQLERWPSAFFFWLVMGRVPRITPPKNQKRWVFKRKILKGLIQGWGLQDHIGPKWGAMSRNGHEHGHPVGCILDEVMMVRYQG